MQLYTSQGTNPRVVRLFLAEKGIDIPTVWVDIAAGENRASGFLAKNPLGQLPVLELDGGQCISQTTAICEYLEELYPAPALIGETPEQRAETRMWLRRTDLLIAEPVAQAFKYSAGLFYYQGLMHCMPDAVEDFKIIARQNLAWLDDQLMNTQVLEGGWICGERFTLVDIQLFCVLDFAGRFDLAIDPGNRRLLQWFERARQRLENCR